MDPMGPELHLEIRQIRKREGLISRVGQCLSRASAKVSGTRYECRRIVRVRGQINLARCQKLAGARDASSVLNPRGCREIFEIVS